MCRIRGMSAHLEVHHFGNALVSILLVIPDFMYLQMECSMLLIGSERQAFLYCYPHCNFTSHCTGDDMEACTA